MEQEFTEDNGMDPGLGESAYSGNEYDLDEFGERISPEDSTDKAISEDDAMSEDKSMPTESTPESNIEDGFGEAIAPETNPHLEDQLGDDKLHDEAETDNKIAEEPMDS